MPFWQFLRNWLIGWIGHALLVQPSISAHRKWPEMVVSASTNQVWTKITIRNYAWSFAIQIQIEAVWCIYSYNWNTISWIWTYVSEHRTFMVSNILIAGPHLSGLESLGHKVTVGNSTNSIGNVVDETMLMPGSSSHT